MQTMRFGPLFALVSVLSVVLYDDEKEAMAYACRTDVRLSARKVRALHREAIRIGRIAEEFDDFRQVTRDCVLESADFWRAQWLN